MSSPNRRTTPSGQAGGSRRPAAVRGSFLERNRSRLLWAVAGIAVVAMGYLTFLNATAPAYACAVEWQVPQTPEPAPSATQRIGIVQDDLGTGHIGAGSFVRYTLCPPASGKHVNQAGEGPYRPGVFGIDDKATPQGWIHNLEHGGLVVLYRCPDGACTEEGLAAMRALYADFPVGPICGAPPGINGPVFARFDEMAWPVAALLWGEILPLDSLDRDRILTFWAQDGERFHPERAGCPDPTPTPAPPTPTPAPSATPAPSPTAVPSPS